MKLIDALETRIKNLVINNGDIDEIERLVEIYKYFKEDNCGYNNYIPYISTDNDYKDFTKWTVTSASI